MNRRQFLGKCACATAAGVLAAPRITHAAQDKPQIRIIYSLHAETQPGPDWPNVGFDFKPVMRKFTALLKDKCPDFDFLTSMATGPEQAQKILDEDKSKNITGYIVYQLNCWNRVVQTIATSGKPVLYADFQFGGSGGFLVYTAAFIRSNAPNVAFVASSNFDDLVAAAWCFRMVVKGASPADFRTAVQKARIASTPKPGRLDCKTDMLTTISPKECVRRMEQSRILAVRSQESGPAGTLLGIPVENVSFAEVNEAWKNADKDKAADIADRWQKEAQLIEGVTRETLENSAAMYLGQKAVLEKHNANAISINCLGGFYGGHIHAYPCLGFHELNNQGLIGACECDLRSTATMVAVTHLTRGRPGMISDPVIDTAKRAIIYAHCVASNRPFGPKGHQNPFQILTHSEDRQGASVRSILPEGYMTTTIEFEQSRKQLLFHQGKAIGNDPDDRACRTKLVAEPIGDIEKLFGQWDQWGWHRVTYYGDLKEPLFALADEMGYKVLQEA
ncbi:MAG: twin-arginine translocation signal domain-containing protein [Sedimentisphaerales bacterium]|nr:twin-arginine translocation signal domain-containing protein [Sedimentisphaerales bacterium]